MTKWRKAQAGAEYADLISNNILNNKVCLHARVQKYNQEMRIM